jgi:hypothetical protein
VEAVASEEEAVALGQDSVRGPVLGDNAPPGSHQQKPELEPINRRGERLPLQLDPLQARRDLDAAA